MAHIAHSPQQVLVPLTALLALGLVIDGYAEALAWLAIATQTLLEPGYLPLILPIWMALAAAKAMTRFFDTQGTRRSAVYVVVMLALALPLSSIHRGHALWSPPSDEEEDSDKKYDALTEEEAFYLQPVLLERALAGLRKQSPGKTELFFIGLAGDAEQSVFLREVLSVQNIMDERFATSGHSVVLVNNYEAAKNFPLASVTALRRTLRRVGETMDRQHDILFLFITSHGGHDHSIQLDFWPLQLDPLNPQILRELLDESAIKWRVVVVSACFSGGFVEALRNDNTVVISAAAPDRTSFGCSDQNDWTYFGKAFFDEALRRENDLPAAFEQAKQAIVRREAEEKIDEPSEPMMAAGNAMILQWRDFVRRREAAGQAGDKAVSAGAARLQKLP
jgi:hypothetical protein